MRFVISGIVEGELLFMAERSKRRAENFDRVRGFLSDIRILQVNRQTAAAYADLKAALLAFYGPRDSEKRSHFRLDRLGFTENDLWIAAAVIRHNLILQSADTDFRRMQKVRSFQVENLWDDNA